jgi:NADH-quinone oxidoreductase subunit A
MAKDFLPVLVLLILSGALAGGMVAFSHLLGPRRRIDAKLLPYECGIVPSASARVRFPIRFYLTAILFVLFDIEVIFLYPWAVVLRQLRLFGFAEMAVFLFILVVGYLYAWRKGALEWE